MCQEDEACPIKYWFVDASANEIASIKDMLCGYDVLSASGGPETIRLLDADAEIAVIVLASDVSSGTDLQVLSLIKTDKRYDTIRIIVLSDSDAVEDEIKYLGLGANDYIRKSVQMQSLELRVRKQLEIIRKRKSSEQDIKNLGILFESVFQQAPIGIAVSHSSEPSGDGEEIMLAVNSLFEQICGRCKEELFEMGWAGITHPDDLEEDMKMFRKLQSGEIGSYSMDKRYMKPDGSAVWVHMVVAALEILNNNIYNHICLIQDITEQKAMITLLEKNKALIRTFIDSSQDFIFLKDDSFRYLLANEALADYYGVGVQALIGQSDYDLMDKELADNCRRTDMEAVSQNKTVNTAEVLKDRVLEARKFPVAMGEGKTGVGAYMRDITIEYQQQEIINKISETNRIIAECMLKPFNSMQEQLDYALREAVKLTGSQYGHIDFYNEDTKEFTMHSWTNGVKDDCAYIEKHAEFHRADMWNGVIRQRKPMIVNDEQAPTNRQHPEGHIRICRYIALPIFENDKIVAVIGCANKKTDYSENDIYTMTVLMSGVWIAIKKKEKEKEKELLLHARNP
jgi:PAS domain S-box-containing protein